MREREFMTETTGSEYSLFKRILEDSYSRRNLLGRYKKGDSYLHASDLWKCKLRIKLDQLGTYNSKVDKYQTGDLLTFTAGLGYEHAIVDLYKRSGCVIGHGEENRAGNWEYRIGGIPDIIVDLGKIKGMDVPEGTLAIVELKTIDFLLLNNIKARPYKSNEMQLLAYMYIYGIPRGYLQYFIKGGIKKDNSWKEFRYYADMNNLRREVETTMKYYLSDWDNLKPEINDQCLKCPYLRVYCTELIGQAEEAAKAAALARKKAREQERAEERKQKKITETKNKKV